jgi:hypothetical protein
MMSRIVFLNIGWMEGYDGVNGDKPEGGGRFVREHGWGGEIFNFRPFRGRRFGYVEARSINVDRLGARPGSDSVRDVLAVWVATKPDSGGRRIVGWYNHATVFRKPQKAPKGADRILPEQSEPQGYFLYAAKDNCHLLPSTERTFEIPSKGPGSFGRANVWYAEGAPKLRHDVTQYVHKGAQEVQLELAKRKYGPKGEGAQHRALKEWCAQNPQALGLGEVVDPGKTEYEFGKTGDRADVVFELPDGGWAVVEVETDFAEPGAHQALKYKVLMCAQDGLPITSDKVQGWLVAHQVPPTVRTFCKAYDLRWREVPPEVVQSSS